MRRKEPNPLLRLATGRREGPCLQFVLPVSFGGTVKKGRHHGKYKVSFAGLDDGMAAGLRRARGRQKLVGGLLLEDVAVELFNQRRRELIAQQRELMAQRGDKESNRGMVALECADAAAAQVADFIGGVTASTIKDWVRGVSRRQRRKPKEQRRYAVRENKKRRSKSD